jgi:cullin 3
MNHDQAEQHWNTMKDAIQRIYAQQASNLSYEELYRTGYNLVLHKHGDMLYNGVRQSTIEQLKPF